MKRAEVIALLVLAGLGVMHAHAQLTGADPLTLTITPNYPRPYESVTIVPQSSVIDLSASTVTVTVNGKTVSKGSGAEAAYVTVGGAGTATTVNVTVVSNGQSYVKSVTLRPADVALVVEPQSTTHPFYGGAALVASEGGVRLIAVPNIRTAGGALVPAANLVYSWRNGEQVLADASGIGKSVLAATSPVRYRDALITVTVSTQDQSVVAEASTLVAPADPLVRLYRNDPLLGPLFGTALAGEIPLAGTEDTFRAVPYYFASAPAIAWRVNHVTNDTDSDITVRASGEGSGTALIDASAVGAGGQSAAAQFSVAFGNESSFDFFGL